MGRRRLSIESLTADRRSQMGVLTRQQPINSDLTEDGQNLMVVVYRFSRNIPRQLLPLLLPHWQGD